MTHLQISWGTMRRKMPLQMTRSRHFSRFKHAGEMTRSRHLWRIEHQHQCSAANSVNTAKQPVLPASIAPSFSAQRKLLCKQAMLTQPNHSLTSFGTSGLNYFPQICFPSPGSSQCLYVLRLSTASRVLLLLPRAAG